MQKIIVIGATKPWDQERLDQIAGWLKDHGYLELGKNLRERAGIEWFDMSTHPEKGDAYQAIDRAIALVVALNLFGIDYWRDNGTCDQGPYFQGKNSLLLSHCMDLGVLFIAVNRCGERPTPNDKVAKMDLIGEMTTWPYPTLYVPKQCF